MRRCTGERWHRVGRCTARSSRAQGYTASVAETPNSQGPCSTNCTVQGLQRGGSMRARVQNGFVLYTARCTLGHCLVSLASNSGSCQNRSTPKMIYTSIDILISWATRRRALRALLSSMSAALESVKEWSWLAIPCFENESLPVDLPMQYPQTQASKPDNLIRS